MRNEELLAKLAEIEGWTLHQLLNEDGSLDGPAYWIRPGFVFNAMNPLTNDAQAFALMVKYNVNIIGPTTSIEDKSEIPMRAVCNGPRHRVTSYVEGYNTVNAAICVAIVGAHL